MDFHKIHVDLVGQIWATLDFNKMMCKLVLEWLDTHHLLLLSAMSFPKHKHRILYLFYHWHRLYSQRSTNWSLLSTIFKWKLNYSARWTSSGSLLRPARWTPRISSDVTQKIHVDFTQIHVSKLRKLYCSKIQKKSFPKHQTRASNSSWALRTVLMKLVEKCSITTSFKKNMLILSNSLWVIGFSTLTHS